MKYVLQNLIVDFWHKKLNRNAHIALRIWSHLLKKSLMENFIFFFYSVDYESKLRNQNF